jgi:hypothetical protein
MRWILKTVVGMVGSWWPNVERSNPKSSAEASKMRFGDRRFSYAERAAHLERERLPHRQCEMPPMGRPMA